jgi:23S rRNA pseudouridine1911/1915/1917 synthase
MTIGVAKSSPAATEISVNRHSAEHECAAGESALVAVVPLGFSGKRLDQTLATLFPAFSRARHQHWIREGRVHVDGKAAARPRDPLRGGEKLHVRLPPARHCEQAAQPIPISIVHQDREIYVVNKQAGLVVHPGAGQPRDTLLNALLYLDPALADIPRAGIIHRLDKDTTGLLVVARTLHAHKTLVEQLQRRAIIREYRAVATGGVIAGGTIAAPIGRHPAQRTRMAVAPGGKPAVTHVRVLERFRAHTLIAATLETGRTHQIRAHMAHIGSPLLGDPLYGRKRHGTLLDAHPQLRDSVAAFRRQALHAVRLELLHPISGERLGWHAPLPADLAYLISALREDARAQPA